MPDDFEFVMQRDLEILFSRRSLLVSEILSMLTIFFLIVGNPTAERSEPPANHDPQWILTKQNDFEDTSIINKEIKYISYISGNQPSSDLLANAAQRLNLKLIAKSDEQLMETQFTKSTILAGVVFDDKEKYPKSLSIRLRFPNQLRSVKNNISENNYWQFRKSGHISYYEAKNKNLLSGIYTREGFLQLQHAIFQEWLTKINKDSEPINLKVAWFIFPKDERNSHALEHTGFVSFLYHFAFCFAFCNTIYIYSRICQKNMLPHLWRYGYNYSTNWFGNMLVTLIKLFILDIAIIVALHITKSDDVTVITFENVKLGHLMIFLIIYNLQYVVCAIFYALIMQHGTKCVLLTLSIWFATYGCFTILLRGNEDINNFFIVILLIVHFNNSFPLGMTYLYNRLDENPHHFWILIGCMMGNIFLYIILVCWVQYLKPGAYMHVYKYDLFFWRSIFGKNPSPFNRHEKKETDKNPSLKNVDTGPLGVEGFVKLKNVCTKYKLFPGKLHLKHINLTMFKGEITVLCGHHSSGKTSLICILAGWQIPDMGSITFGKLDLHENWKKARRICDVSMPTNSLFDYLTVRSTLVHFIQMKQKVEDFGYLEAEVRKWLQVLKPVIQNHNQIVYTLSFEQKRLLCLAIALSCDTEVILLDEPTDNMRLKEKYIYWNILRAERSNRVIFYATCSLDDANFIGDRIALLDNGKLLAYGTPFYLRTSFSDFYYFVIYKDNEAPSIPISRIVLSYIPDITVEHDISSRIMYKLPNTKRASFQHMLINLEKSAIEMGIHSMQIMTGTLNEVVMVLTKDKVKPLHKPSSTYFEYHKIDQEKSYSLQFHAMIFKKILNQIPHLWVMSIVLISIVLTVIVGKLSVVLDTALPRHSPTQFGLDSTATERSGLPSWSIHDCSFIRLMECKTDKPVKIFNSNTHFFHKDAYECHKDENFEHYLTISDPSQKKHLAAIESSQKNNWIIWLNKREIEAGPVALNLVHNLILQEYFPDDKEYFIKISNDPFLMNVVTKSSIMRSTLSHISVPLIAGIVVPLMISCFILKLIEERNCHMWTIQRLAGLHLGIYWIVTLLWDWFTFTIFAFMFIVVQALVIIEGMEYKEKLWLFFILVIYGVSALGFLYIMSMFSKKSKTNGYLIYLLVSLSTGIVAYNIFWDVLKVSEFQKAIWYLLMLSPHFAMLQACSSIYMYAKIKSYCDEICDLYSYDGCVKTGDKVCLYSQDCCEMLKDKTELQDAITYIICSAGLCFFGMFVTKIIRNQRSTLTGKNITRYKTACFHYDDPDVKELREEVAFASAHDLHHKTYIVDQLEYELPKTPGLMNTISFEAQKGQCISIYGHHRSENSRLARLLTGINSFKFGSIYAEGIEMKTQLLQAWHYVAYCPPNEGLYNSFTAFELMIYLAMIAGTPSKDVTEMVEATFQLLNMRGYVNTKCGHLSVEKRRKVNIAATIIISKSVLIFDQPTNGLPLSTSQEIWNALLYLLELGRTIVFTTCSLIESNMLADKMLIYERGEMLAYGDGYFFLLNRYAKGIFLEVKLNYNGDSPEHIKANLRTNIENLYRYVSYLESNSELCSCVENMVIFYLPIQSIQYSALFGSLEKNKVRLNISDYKIIQCSIQDLMYTILNLRNHRLRLYLQ